ncbi:MULTISPECIES: type II secretion system inner membrane protein GspF [unclassified Colwellia]|uniref:type II secretion system inner membrane protein GspF n=1 Tax=unclassified Colwellia TaxID=196834 RepID=UPI0015F77004|nr:MULTISPECIES: type II secretion system inner membrane protein GspF [unclassified Colwellia]MBA6232849.1 type II secretion system inner membrane protein GspF [Colwellia sp. MB02u-7]MBA6236058.1 type II secretion system inner membrane protein GspF [Colwellia sp. MB02u-11]MBA6256688.1 type II secretion system inner membrane protein GspF [Colwellia sp. MB3u-28]MBA6261403.1 type II secretion system inner membrane protein GspF [Colwellia sp. MB3u-41]MBA6298537.1 type II secretion system inner mem
MAAFDYQAVNSRGKAVKGVIEGDTPRHVRGLLRDKGLMPTEVTPSLQKTKQAANKSRFAGRTKVSVAELALITRQLATLVESGLPIEESLLAVGEQCEKNSMKSMIMAVRTKVTEGYGLAESMSEFPYVFSGLYRAMVAAGEKSGFLDTVLNRLADYTEQRELLRSQIIQALIYPVIMTVVAIGVIAILLTAVVPKIVGQFDHMGASLPASTQFLISASDFLRDNGLYILILITLLIAGFTHLMKKATFKFAFHQKVISLPGIGKIIRGINTARFARTLSILTASAVPLLESMKISGEVLENLYIKKCVKESADKVREGASLRVSLEQTKLFPPMMLHMIASGEKSGKLEHMLGRSADNQDREFEALMNISLKAFEPALMIVMAGIVLFIVMAILQPILQLNTLVGG